MGAAVAGNDTSARGGAQPATALGPLRRRCAGRTLPGLARRRLHHRSGAGVGWRHTDALNIESVSRETSGGKIADIVGMPLAGAMPTMSCCTSSHSQDKYSLFDGLRYLRNVGSQRAVVIEHGHKLAYLLVGGLHAEARFERFAELQHLGCTEQFNCHHLLCLLDDAQ